MTMNYYRDGCLRVYSFLGAVFNLIIESQAGTHPVWRRRKSQTQTVTSLGFRASARTKMPGRTGAARNMPRPVRAARIHKKS
ncbi:MAG: hypothetical protein KBC33_01575 [Candidatus Pacebacteria bacterium]|nr:hypothetical protein [Candidatus Paceibacterota bacterium]